MPKRPKQRKSIPPLLQKQLLQEVGNRCAFCGIVDQAVLEFHHIDEDRSNCERENLIVVCANCHSKITRQEIEPAEVRLKKTELLWTHPATFQQPEKSPTQSVSVNAGDVSHSNIANNIIMRGKARARIQPPPNAIGADAIKAGYIQYLIQRYYDYRQADASYGDSRPFHPAEINTNIQRKFKATRALIHVSRFEELCNYIKGRVDQTIQGKRNRATGKPNYSTFEEYEAEQMGQGR